MVADRLRRFLVQTTPHGTTSSLVAGDAVAIELAGKWDGASPKCGMPLFNAHGYSEVGVFYSYSSLHQPPRTKAKETGFQRALRSSALWFAHERTTAYVVVGMDMHLEGAPRQSRG